MLTGYKIIDALLPIGRGQRELTMVIDKLVKLQLLLIHLKSKTYNEDEIIFTVFMLESDKKKALS
jgi:F0F1-type ATP synthase alpha subunit